MKTIHTASKPDGTTIYHEINFGDIGHCAVTPAMVREAVLGGYIVSGPGVDKRMMPTAQELDDMVSMAQWAISRGQMFDFGYWPNDLIREVGFRSGPLYGQGALGHPFSSPYLIVHSWRDDKLPFGKMLAERGQDNTMTCAYLVRPFPPSQPGEICVDFEATVFEGQVINGTKVLGVGDRVLVDHQQTAESGTYACHVIPFIWRFPELMNDPHARQLGSNRDGADVLQAACNNVLDPIMVALTLLNTRGITYQTVKADERLNKARIKRGKSPIPPYRQVDSASYVTAVMQKLEYTKKPPTGTHASPIMHIRQGHWRHYADGEKSFIRDTLVNATEELRAQFVAGRSHYVFKSEE